MRKTLVSGLYLWDEARIAQDLRLQAGLLRLVKPGQDGTPLHQRILQEDHGIVCESGLAHKAQAEAGVFAAVR